MAREHGAIVRALEIAAAFPERDAEEGRKGHRHLRRAPDHETGSGGSDAWQRRQRRVVSSENYGVLYLSGQATLLQGGAAQGGVKFQ
jgi:hypothetical protein